MSERNESGMEEEKGTGLYLALGVSLLLLCISIWFMFFRKRHTPPPRPGSSIFTNEMTESERNINAAANRAILELKDFRPRKKVK